MDDIALLQRLDDDVVDVDPVTRQAARAALRARMALAPPDVSQRHLRTRRRLGSRRARRPVTVAATAVLVVGLVIAGMVIPGRVDRRANAATPPLLLPIDEPGVASRPLLEQLAAAAGRQPPLGDGHYRYHRSASWYLHTTVHDADTASSVVVPAVTESWVAPDGSGLVREAQGDPVDARPLAAFYRMLAAETSLRSFGRVTDRAGRDGIAVGFDSDDGGLPTRYLLIADPETGTPLGSEEILTTDAGKLAVDVPAVIGYAVYLAGGNVDDVHQRGPRIPST